MILDLWGIFFCTFDGEQGLTDEQSQEIGTTGKNAVENGSTLVPLQDPKGTSLVVLYFKQMSFR